MTGLLSAVALIAFMLESLFPPLVIPGARMGISNVFILLAGVLLGVPSSFCVLTVKVVLGSLFSGNLSSIMYSLPAGALSLGVELLLLYLAKNVSIIAISVVGSILNVTVQNAVFCLVTETAAYLVYLPYLALVGVLAGLIVGFAVWLCVKKLPASLFVENDGQKN